MRRVFLLIVALSTALILAVAEATLNHQQPVVANLVTNSTGCYRQTPDARTVDLDNLCCQPQTTSTSNRPSQFIVDDQVVSAPAGHLADPEFNQVDSLMTWQDGKNQLWVAV